MPKFTEYNKLEKPKGSEPFESVRRFNFQLIEAAHTGRPAIDMDSVFVFSTRREYIPVGSESAPCGLRS
jgi:hypothetical protein